MAWRQIKDADMNTPYVGGWCEGFVAGAWRQSTLPTISNQTTSGTWGSAMAKWNANPGNGNHPNELPPVGKTVPVYFSLGNVPQGHTAISLDDGGIASSSLPGFHTSPYYYKNLNACIADYGKYNGGCTYLGWSEYVGKIQVIAQDNPGATREQVIDAYLDILERNPTGVDEGGISHYMNYANDTVRADLMGSVERATLLANKAAAEQARLAKIETDRLAAEKKAQELAAAVAVQEAAAKAKVEADKLAEAERIKAAQLLLDNQLAQLEADKKVAEAEALAKQATIDKLAADKLLAEQTDNNTLYSWVKSLINIIISFLKSWRK